MVFFYKIIWEVVSIGNVLDNKGIKDLMEESILGLEGSGN